MIKVLSIGQLPKEIGGNYTTGIARVFYALSKKKYPGCEMYWYATNMADTKCKKISDRSTQYVGFKMRPLYVFLRAMMRLRRTYKEWIFYKKKCHINPLRFEFYRYNFDTVIRDIQPDIIHLHGAGIAPLFFANSSFRIPLIYTLHGVMWDGENDSEGMRKYEAYKATLPMANYYTALNAEVKRKMLALDVNERQISIIPNGSDSKQFDFSITERERLRSLYNANETTIVFITVGVVIDRKGQYDTLLMLKSLGIDYQYWIIGKGPDEEKIMQYVKDNEIENRVKMLGYIDGSELYKYLSAADVYAHSSTTEGQALSEIEAYTNGLRIIVNKKIAETVVGDISNSDIYYTVDFSDYRIEDIKLWLTSRSYPRTIRTGTDWQNIAEKYCDLYKQILNRC